MSGTPAGHRHAAGIVAVAALAVAATFLPGESLELRRDAGLLRIVTCHLTHWSYEQLAWDALAFTALGVACARRHACATHATLLASAVMVPAAVLAFSPEIGAYRGLSGLASAMFALLLTTVILSASKDVQAPDGKAPAPSSRLRMTASVFAILFAAKLTFEAVTGGAVFASDMGDGVVAVPVAHLAGAIAGVLCGVLACSSTLPSCASPSPCSSR